MKRQPTIAADDVPRIFDDQCVERLAKLGLPPDAAYPEHFAPAILKAVDIYAEQAAVISDNDVHHEIDELYRAADQRKYEKAADLVRKLSAEARAFLKKRRVPPSLRWKIPDDPDVLLRPAMQDHVCETIVHLCLIGGHQKEGRSGRPSTFVPHLHAPPLRRHFPKRQAELNFVMNLQFAYAEATDETPPLTARHVTPNKRLLKTKYPRKRLGAFARMVQECLRLVGRPDADVVELINELQRRANKQLRKQTLRAGKKGKQSRRRKKKGKLMRRGQ